MTNAIRTQTPEAKLVSSHTISLWQLYRSDNRGEVSSITFRTKSGNIYLLDCYGDISSTRDEAAKAKHEKVNTRSAIAMNSTLSVGKSAIIPFENGTTLLTTDLDYIAYSEAKIENVDEARRLVESNPNLPSALRK